VKLNAKQAFRVHHQLYLHRNYNNAEACSCYQRYMDVPNSDKTESINALLEAGDPYLTQIVVELVLDKLS
jgi:hypothetical protein